MIQEPFPHIVIDNFTDPEILRGVLEEFPTTKGGKWITMINGYEKKRANEDPDRWGLKTRELMKYLISKEYVSELEKLTGIENLIVDPTFRGGGLHYISEGGFLGIHTDFNQHHRRPEWYRRLNLLIFLNDEWPEEDGGYFELWSRDGKEKVKAIAPIFNRAVIFATSESSFHGHPRPLAPGRERRSLALYYYSLEPAEDAERHGTNFVTGSLG